MKSKSSALHRSVEPSSVESTDLDETATLPALFIAGDLKDCNDEDAGPLESDQEHLSPRLIELGESINRNLERIATALEKLPSEVNRPTPTPKRATKSVTSRKKKASKTTRKKSTTARKKSKATAKK